jgi:PTS system ascorbate-specific IIB component
MKIVAVCGVGTGTSALLKITADKALKQLGVTATVSAASLEDAKQQRDAQIFLATANIADQLRNTPTEVIVIDRVMDVAEVAEKLGATLL